MSANTTIQIKRSFANSSPASLKEGELAYSFVSNTLFIGNQSNSAVSLLSPNLTLKSLSADFLDLTKLPYTQSPPYDEGRVWYDLNAHNIQIQTDFPAFDAVPGQIEYIRVYNGTGSQINFGKPVYISGVKGTSDPVASRILSVGLADATDIAKKDVIGLAGHNIPSGSEGFVICRGPMYGLDTSTLSQGNRFHLGTSPGELTAYAPEYPYYPTDIGECLVSSSTGGTVYVDIAQHSIERLRLESDGYVGGNFTVEGDLQVLGEIFTVSKTNVRGGGRYVYLNAGDTIDAGNTTFTGTGLNDATFKGTYSGDPASTAYYVRISSVGIYDFFDWSFNSSFSPLQGSNIQITTAKQALANGISVQFTSTRGHTIGDKWAGVAYSSYNDFGIVSNFNDGTYSHAGLFRDASDGEFKFFSRYNIEPEQNIDVSNSSFRLGNVRVEKITANSFVQGGVDLLNAINSAANAVAVYANSNLRVANVGLNFINTATIRAVVSSSGGLANVGFDFIGQTGGIASFPVLATGGTVVSANGLNFVNSATVGVTVSQGTSGNANISFTTLAGGGTVTSVGTGVGLTGGPISTSGTISANIANTSVQGVTKLIDVVTSNDSANAATANSVKVTFDQATAAYAQANSAYTQANTANSIAISAFGQANLAYSQANTANSIAISAYGQANAAYTQANTANSIAISAYGQANAAYSQANAAYTQANTANSIAIFAYGQANAAFTAANNAANTVRVTANSGVAQSAVSLNFINTASVLVSVVAGATGNANVAFSAVAGSTTVPGILQLTDSVTSTSTTTAATPNSVKTAFDQATLAYGQANAAYTQANTANSIAISAYGQANLAYTAANNAANTVRVTANSGTAQSAVSLNFVNTATIRVNVGGGSTGNANLSFDFIGGGTTTIAVSGNTAGPTVAASGVNFNNTSTIRVNVGAGVTGNANVSFDFIGGGTTTIAVSGNTAGPTVAASGINFNNTSSVQVSVGSGITGNANVAFSVVSGSTTTAGILQLTDSVTSTSITTAATPNSVKVAFDQATTAYGQANAAYTQANTANSIAISAYGAANAALAKTISANGGSTQTNASINFINTASIQVSVGTISAGNSNVAFTAVAGSTTVPGIVQLNDTVTSTSTAVAATANAVKTAYDFAATKYSSSGGVISGDVTITGNLILTGSTSQLNVTNLSVNDTIILLGTNNISDVLDIGFVGHYRTGGGINSHAGIIRHASDKIFYVFENYEVEPTNNVIDVAGNNFRLGNVRLATMNANSVLILGTPVATTTDVGVAYGQANVAYTQANLAYNQANAAFTTANNAANTTRVSANGGSIQSAVSLNFINTASVQVSVGAGAAGNANVGFSAVAGSTTVPGILQLTDSVTSTSITTAATPNSVKTAFDQATLAYGQANTANSIAIAAYGQANLAYAAANSAANAVRVTANSGPALSNVSLNFVNTATVQVSVTSGGTGISNIAFTSTATGTGSGINTFPVSANAGATVTANGINFVNSATVTVVVTPGVNGNANVSFTSTGGTGTPGGSNTQIQFNNNGSFGGSPKFTYNTSPNLVSVDADLKLANTNKLYFGGEQANNSVANSKFSISFNVSATSLDFTFLG